MAVLHPIEAPAQIDTASGLRLHLTTRGDTPVFERFFTGYDRAFVLPNEKELREGFESCFALNHGAEYARLSALYGPYCEVSLTAEHEGREIGGANFIAMPTDDGAAITANLSYIYIEENARGRGYLGRLCAAAREAIRAVFAASEAISVLIFIEQNDPFRLSEEDYRRDTAFTGLDQLDRLRIWRKLGARVVDFPYRQPPLSDAQGVDDTLLYSVLGARDASLPACVLAGHLRRFFGVSVLKGAPIESNGAAHAQISALARACAGGVAIALLDPGALLDKLAAREDIARLWPQNPPADFRAAMARL